MGALQPPHFRREHLNLAVTAHEESQALLYTTFTLLWLLLNWGGKQRSYLFCSTTMTVVKSESSKTSP